MLFAIGMPDSPKNDSVCINAAIAEFKRARKLVREFWSYFLQEKAISFDSVTIETDSLFNCSAV